MSWHNGGHVPRRIWRRLRLQVFERDGWRCVDCGRAGRLECDHVVPLSMGGYPTDPLNLATRCRSCHITKTRGENLARALTRKRLAWRHELERLFS